MKHEQDDSHNKCRIRNVKAWPLVGSEGVDQPGLNRWTLCIHANEVCYCSFVDPVNPVSNCARQDQAERGGHEPVFLWETPKEVDHDGDSDDGERQKEVMSVFEVAQYAPCSARVLRMND